MFSAKDIFQTKAKGGYTIAKSLRFRSSASAYLSRTPGSAGNRQVWTWSAWVKRGAISQRVGLFGQRGSDTPGFGIEIQADNTILLSSSGDGGAFLVSTNAVFRDPSAWYHIVATIDTTLSSGRCVVYVNNVSQSFSTNTTSLNYNTGVNTTNAHEIGRLGASALSPLDGYMAEINFIDGQALDPTYFGQTDTATGVWMPKACTVSDYGKNGFYLPFNDTTSTTALGYDKAAIATNHSAANNWTPSANISLTAGTTYDSMVDTPTNYDNGGNGAGNYAVLNPLAVSSNAATMSNANLSFSPSPATNTRRQGTIAVSTGKWYFEVSPTTLGGNFPAIGVMLATTNDFNNYVGAEAGTFGYYSSGGVNGGGGGRTYSSYTTTDIIGVAIDCDNSQITFYKNNSNAVTSGTTYESLTAGASYIPAASGYNSAVFVFNFGQRGFDNSTVWATLKASGYKALCTQNLPTPTIGATSSTLANKYFDVDTYTATGAARSRTGFGFQPDFVWIKARNHADDHNLFDAVRGTLLDLRSDTTAAEITAANTLTSFNSDGYSLGSDASHYGVNAGTDTYVAWLWKANGSGSTGSGTNVTNITISANATAGFSVVKYTGAGTAGSTVNHGLGVVPSMIIVKSRGSATSWFTWHSKCTSGSYVLLNTTDAQTSAFMPNLFGNASAYVAPTSSVFTIGDGSWVNSNGTNYVAYCFAEVAGYSKFGSYTGNGSTDGPFVYCGFRPRYIMIKNTADNTTSWSIWDTARSTYNVPTERLEANASSAESSLSQFDILSNGFKLRSTNANNASGQTIIFAAFAETPFNYSRGR